LLSQPTINLRNKNFLPIEGHGYHGFVRGYFYFNEKYIHADNFSKEITMSDLKPSTIEKWNGEFACIITMNEVTTLISDKKRTIPLFYSQIENTSWKIQDFVDVSDSSSIDEEAVNDYLLTGYVTGNKTLLSEWFQTEASTIVELRQQQEVINYFTFQTDIKEQSFESLVNELKLILNQIFDDVRDRIGDKQIILPLSGGYDSRIIALMLNERNLSKQITSFTYGKPNNLEANVSKQIAARIGLEWRYYPYNKAMWEEMYASNEWKDYVDFSFNGASAPHLQDFPSVKNLLNEMDKQEMVFMPGHSLDFLAGSHLPYEAVYAEEISYPEVIDFIQNKHFKLWQTEQPLEESVPEVRSRIEKVVPAQKSFSNELACSILDDWNLKERQAKFIINSVRVYEFYDQEWTLPLWDDRLITFFKKVPVKWKYKKFLYEVALHEMFPDYFEMPKPNEKILPLKNKYGVLYPILKRGYRTQKLWKQYYNEPMEWFGIYPSYYKYLSNLTFKKDGIKFSNPYNINSFIVKDTLDSLRGITK